MTLSRMTLEVLASYILETQGNGVQGEIERSVLVALEVFRSGWGASSRGGFEGDCPAYLQARLSRRLAGCNTFTETVAQMVEVHICSAAPSSCLPSFLYDSVHLLAARGPGRIGLRLIRHILRGFSSESELVKIVTLLAKRLWDSLRLQRLLLRAPGLSW